MTWEDIARKDFQDAIRSRWLWGLSAIFAFIVTATAAAMTAIPDIALVFLLRVGPEKGTAVSSNVVVQAMNGLLVTPLVPLIALVVSHGAVSHERESGSLKLLLALPHSREDVVLGKTVGRAATMVTAVVVGFVVPFVVMAVIAVATDSVAVDVLGYLGYVVLASALAVVFVCIGVGISASVETQFRALVTMLVFYVVFIVLWVALQAVSGLALAMLAGGWPSWMPFTFGEFHTGLKVLNPTGSFKIISRAFLNDVLFAPNPPKGMPPFYLQLSALLMLVFWTVAPLVVGLYRFASTDL